MKPSPKPESPALAGYEFQLVVVPKFATETAVAVSVRGDGKKSSLIISLSRRLVETTGMEPGQHWECHCDPKRRAIMLVRGDSPSARKVMAQDGTRCRVAYPFRPFSKIMPPSMPSTPAKFIAASAGRVVFELPSG